MMEKSFFLALVLAVSGLTAHVLPGKSLIVTTGKPVETSTEEKVSLKPQIYEMLVLANVSNRFSNVLVVSKVRNLGDRAQEAHFSVILPETAYITGFIMEIDKKNYTGRVKEKYEAKDIYINAVISGESAGYVESSARNSNKFTISVNVEPASKASFYLTYEELLQRKDHYEVVINVHPKQPVENLKVEVHIKESKPLKFVRVKPFRSGNSLNEVAGPLLDSKAQIFWKDKEASVKFHPDLEKQKELAEGLKLEEEGLAGQFVVEYDVARAKDGGEILIRDGYFVHFFSPANIPPLAKQVVFVLDTSGSMMFQKIEQLKVAMKSILKELKDIDAFHIVEFNNGVKVWDLENFNKSVKFPEDEDPRWFNEYVPFRFEEASFPRAFAPTEEVILKACQAVEQMDANGGTNIFEGLRVAVKLIEVEKRSDPENQRQPMIIFLTDGEPTIGVTDLISIQSQFSEQNVFKIPTFALSFGDGADRDFLEKLSLRNFGFSRHIYEAADAVLQLKDFYKEISSPMLTDVKFKYTESSSGLSKTVFPIYFAGSEFVITGNYDDIYEFKKHPEITAWGIQGPIDLRPTFEEPVGELERLWAYITVQQLLQKEKTDPNDTESRGKALDLSLRYSFVTPLTSLVVIKRDEETVLKPETADRPHFEPEYAAVATRKQISANLDISYYDADALKSSYVVEDFFPGKTEELLRVFPWFSGIYNGGNETIRMPHGSYKLSDNPSLNGNVTCSNPPLHIAHSTAHCVLLELCTAMYPLLINADVYEEHFCVVAKEYAGVCCPDYYANS